LTVVAWALLLSALIVLVLAALVFTPTALRGIARQHRLAQAARGGPDGAVAAWREVLADFRDRGSAPGDNDTVRSTARRLARTYRLDTEAVGGMKTVVGALERGWYARHHDPGPGTVLVGAVDSVRSGLSRSAPLPLRARLWPRSVLPSKRGWQRMTERIRHRLHALLGG